MNGHDLYAYLKDVPMWLSAYIFKRAISVFKPAC